MDINHLEYHILKDAEQGDLLPTALISKYDVTLDRLMDVLKSMLHEGYLNSGLGGNPGRARNA